MLSDWTILPEAAAQLVATEARQRAISLIANLAESLADQVVDGEIADDGGASAMRLLAVIIRDCDDYPVRGHA